MMAVCAAAARRELTATAPSDMPVDPAVQSLAVSANYLAAPDPGDVDIVATVRKRGRQVSLVDVELSQNGRPAVHAAVTLGVPDAGSRTTRRSRRSRNCPPSRPPRRTRSSPTIRWRRSCTSRRAAICGSTARRRTSSAAGRANPRSGCGRGPWADDEQDPATAALFAIMTGDICAPVTMNRGIFGWAPTVQLTTYLRRRPAPGWLRVMASSTVLGDTWFEEDHTVLDSTGAVVVQSRQLAMIPR